MVACNDNVVYNERRAVISVECASTVLRVQHHSTRNFGLSIKDFRMGRGRIGQVGHLGDLSGEGGGFADVRNAAVLHENQLKIAHETCAKWQKGNTSLLHGQYTLLFDCYPRKSRVVVCTLCISNA